MPEDLSPSCLWQEGIFETLKSEKREIVALDEHISRLFESAHAIGLSLGYSRKRLKRLLNKELASKPYSDAYVRIAFLREDPPVPRLRRANKKTRLFLIVKEAKRYSPSCYQKGVSIRTNPTRRNTIFAVDAQLKVRDFLNGLLSTLDGQLSEVTLEEIYLDSQGYVTEGRISNIFMAKEKRLFTPPTFLGVLGGITRGQVMAEANRLKIPVHEEPFTRFNLYAADEAFLTNTSMGAMPVVSVDGRMIGDGKVGRITKYMAGALLSQRRSQETSQKGFLNA